MEEDEMPPHSIRREMMCYRIINEERKHETPIITLLAAFRDESDPFSVAIDLIMPLYSCTLEELMDEPLMQFNIGDLDQKVTIASEQRPAFLLARKIQSFSLHSYLHSTCQAVFSALSFLHSHSIAHRDIKPSNILVNAGTLSIVLIDFGTCYLKSYREGDDGLGGMTSEVGTGAYRAPESLFSPLNGYNVFKLDIWQAGVTLIQFFLPLKKVEVAMAREERQIEIVKEDSDSIDDRPEWEKALWADDAGLSWSKLEDVWNSDKSKGELKNGFYDNEYDDDDDDEKEESMSGWKRETLFDATRGDLGLANSMFDLKGLPQNTSDWTEAEHFQPSLSRMPFTRRPPAIGGIQQRLSRNGMPPTIFPIIDILDQCIQLSSSKRISADEAVEQLQRALSKS